MNKELSSEDLDEIFNALPVSVAKATAYDRADIAEWANARYNTATYVNAGYDPFNGAIYSRYSTSDSWTRPNPLQGTVSALADVLAGKTDEEQASIMQALLSMANEQNAKVEEDRRLLNERAFKTLAFNLADENWNLSKIKEYLTKEGFDTTDFELPSDEYQADVNGNPMPRVAYFMWKTAKGIGPLQVRACVQRSCEGVVKATIEFKRLPKYGDMQARIRETWSACINVKERKKLAQHTKHIFDLPDLTSCKWATSLDELKEILAQVALLTKTLQVLKEQFEASYSVIRDDLSTKYLKIVAEEEAMSQTIDDWQEKQIKAFANKFTCLTEGIPVDYIGDR